MNITQYVHTIKTADKFRKFTLASAKGLRPVTTVAHRFGPEILTGTGIVGGLGTVVLASKATLKLEALVDSTKNQMEIAKERFDTADIDEKEYHKELVTIRARGLGEIVKLYAPAATLGLASTAAVLGAHGVLKRRNVALVAAYKAIESSFEQYRKRVIDEYGEDKDRDYRYGFVEKELTDKETGKKKTVTEVLPGMPSIYARFFDESSTEWSKTPEYNLVKLLAKQNYANDLLKARGHLFLNEVYDDLGLSHSQAGAICGWIDKGDGDNYVDFGIYDMNSTPKRNFVNGFERNILLDFNVDGVIFDKI